MKLIKDLTKIKPCNCSKRKDNTVVSYTLEGDIYQIKCRNCGVDIGNYTTDTILKEWNMLNTKTRVKK